MTELSSAKAAGAVEKRLADLGRDLPEVAAPVGVYAPAVTSGRYAWTSGQLPFVDGKLTATGKVGQTVDPETAQELAATSALNALAAVKSVIGDLDRVVRVVKVVGFVASDPSFTGQPQVLNGASDLIGSVFADAGVHARSAVGVAVLPMDSPVEVELVVEFD
ncbi:RidA family protein [Tersicoccus sp. MR15.9]|uniref:RidA family protein n=1 Tax=Tersicoccus mangrovi TaxID=3121635 RepID=UPI002FE63841